jgi:hypothetical protein
MWEVQLCQDLGGKGIVDIMIALDNWKGENEVVETAVGGALLSWREDRIIVHSERPWRPS